MSRLVLVSLGSRRVNWFVSPSGETNWCPSIGFRNNMLNKLLNWFAAKKASRQISNWYVVTFDEVAICLDVSPPGKDAWSYKLRWEDIRRVCFEATDYLNSDRLHLFTGDSDENTVIPIEANGGSELWTEILDRQLFDAELAIHALTAMEGIFCWPAIESTSKSTT